MQQVASRALVVVLLVLSGCSHGNQPRTPAPLRTEVSGAELDSLWGRAMAKFTHGKWRDAATLFERVTLEVPATDTLAVAAHFRLAECYFAQKNQLQAAREFRRVSDDSPLSHLAPEALLRAGDAYADLWRKPELDPTYGQTALSTYQELLNRYPDVPAAARARLQIAQLEELFARKELRSAEFYIRLKAYDSAILYLKDLVATYPRASVTPAALLKLVAAYRIVGYTEDLQETCGYIRRFHPTTEGLAQSCPAPVDSAAAGT
ncbi:MAG: outer membrane protein assembly factor BamD [Gemmatimonadales bacterium]